MEFISLCENNLDSQKLLSNKIPDMTISKKWTIHEKDTLRKYLMIFGFNRWSVIKQSTTGILTEKSDVEMRAFANSFLRCIIDSITAENQSLKEFLTSLINEEPDDPLVISHPDDWGVLMKQKAIAWGKRIQLINRVNVLVEKFISEQNKNIDLREQAESAENKEELMGQVNLTYDNWENLLNFLPVNAFYGQRPVGWWTRTNDIDLIRGTYKWGYANYTSMRNDPDLSFIQMEKDSNFQDFPNADTITRRLKKLMQIVSKSETENGDINFEDTSGLKEPTGFTLSEKRDILKVMTVIGIPLTAEGKSDWNKMKEMLNKELPDIQIKQVQQLERMAQRLRMIAQIVLQIEENRESGKESAVYANQLDPDEDGFEMSFEEAEALTRNINLLNFVRRNILKSNPKFLASTFGVLQETLTKYLQSGLSLPANWVSSVHDRGLLLAVDDNGLGYIGKLSDNYVYGFDSSCLNRYLQLRGRTS